MGNVVNLLDIQQIIVGGGVAMGYGTYSEPPRIAKARLGSGAGVIGAATLAMTVDCL